MNDTEIITNYIHNTPKTELHLHIEGSLEPELMFKLSKRNKIEIPFKSVEEIRSAYNFTNLDSFLKIYYQGSNVLITEEDFFDLTWEYILRCKQDNIVHTEIFFDGSIVARLKNVTGLVKEDHMIFSDFNAV